MKAVASKEVKESNYQSYQHQKNILYGHSLSDCAIYKSSVSRPLPSPAQAPGSKGRWARCTCWYISPFKTTGKMCDSGARRSMAGRQGCRRCYFQCCADATGTPPPSSPLPLAPSHRPPPALPKAADVAVIICSSSTASFLIETLKEKHCQPKGRWRVSLPVRRKVWAMQTECRRETVNACVVRAHTKHK